MGFSFGYFTKGDAEQPRLKNLPASGIVTLGATETFDGVGGDDDESSHDGCILNEN
jgi:hypothetical protein